MIKYIEIQGFRSLREIKIDMRPLSVLIGPNGSGKSNLLDAFCLLNEAAWGSLGEGIARRGGLDSLLFRGGDSSLFFRIDFEPAGPFEEEHSTVHYKVEVRPVASVPTVWYEQVSKDQPGSPDRQLYLVQSHRGKHDVMFRNIVSGEREEIKELRDLTELAIFQVKDQTSYPTPYKVLSQMSEWRFYPPIDAGPNAEIRKPQTIRSGLRVFSDCSNLVSVLHAIQQRHPGVWQDICQTLQAAYHDFVRIGFPAEGGDGKVILRWWERPFEDKAGFSGEVLSDGTLRLLALLAILKTPDPPPLVLIEEPEIGLHPDWIKLVAELLQSAATRTQLVVATHSPELVSKLEPEEVVVVEKRKGETAMQRLSRDELSVWLEKFRLGELWRSGHIGGRP